MNRHLLLLAAAVLGAGCGSRDCPAQALRIYWTPGATGPTAGFSVPGLVAAGFPAQMGCAAAGLDNPTFSATGPRVEVRINDVQVACRYPDPCVGTDWACTTDGIEVVGYPLQAGGNKVEVFGYSGLPSSSTMTFYGGVEQPAGCDLTTIGVVSGGLAGPLGIDYVFVPTANCHSATSRIDWELRSGVATGPVFDTGSVLCGGTNPFLVYGGADVPAGVYTLTNVAELDATVSYHAYCSSSPLIHAGGETLLVDMPLSGASCF
jgi:hypothetical protein